MLTKITTTLAATLLVSASYAGVQTDRPYQELGRAQHFNLVVPGYVLAIEKRDIKQKDKLVLDGIEDKDKPYAPRFFAPASSSDEAKTGDRVFKRTTAQLITKVMLVTHITKSVSYDGNNYSQYLYNAYAQDLDGKFSFAESVLKVDAMFVDMATQLQQAQAQGKPFTHVMVMSMGWNNDQVESLYRFNTILKNVQQEATTQKQLFRPLVICFTWPSVWGGVNDSKLIKRALHLASYGNKPDDADEIGFTWANWVVNKKLPEALAQVSAAKPKVVLLGHSFGARLLSRALFSAEFINQQYPVAHSVDVFLGLQGAFSLNRFVAGAGAEDSPYADFKSLPGLVVLTSSDQDDANKAAKWAQNAGGVKGLEFARKNPSVFNLMSYKNIQLNKNQVNIIDASAIVKDESDQVDAHNDILDADMAKLIWSVIRE